MKLELQIRLCTKIDLQWNKDLNVLTQVVNVLSENTWVNL